MKKAEYPSPRALSRIKFAGLVLEKTLEFQFVSPPTLYCPIVDGLNFLPAHSLAPPYADTPQHEC